MSERKEIKVPAAQKWREFRMRFLPVLVFAAVLGVAAFLWDKTVLGPTMVGEVEIVQAYVTAPAGGVLTNFLVKPFQLVKEGEPLAEVIVTDVRSASGQAQDLRSRIAMSQLEVNSIIDRDRMAFDYQAMSMNTLRFRAELAEARAQLPTLEATTKRLEQGVKDQVIAINEYETMARERDAVSARVKELEYLVEQAEERVRQAGQFAGTFTNMATGDRLGEALNRLRREGQQSGVQETVLLRAPRAGSVGMIYRRGGENVLAGETILAIHALEAERIVTYLRPGSPIIPTKGMNVRVRCRSKLREEAVSQIEEVGFRYEMVTNIFLMRPGSIAELGMPIGVSMPAALKGLLRPGELVDLALEP